MDQKNLGRKQGVQSSEIRLVLLLIIVSLLKLFLVDFMEIHPVHPKGDQSWVFIGRTDVEAETPVFWPPDVKS